jgi:hypothetical protein
MLTTCRMLSRRVPPQARVTAVTVCVTAAAQRRWSSAFQQGTADLTPAVPTAVSATAGAAVPPPHLQQQPQPPLWDDCDTVEDIMDEVKFGSRAEQEQEARIEAAKLQLQEELLAQSAAGDGAVLGAGCAAQASSVTIESPLQHLTRRGDILSEEDLEADAQREAERQAAARVAAEIASSLPFDLPNNISPEDHHAVARRALFLGSVLAVCFFSALLSVGMLLMGFTSLLDVLTYVGSKDSRDVAALRARGEEVVVMDLDITDTNKFSSQLADVIEVVQRFAAEPDHRQPNVSGK